MFSFQSNHYLLKIKEVIINMWEISKVVVTPKTEESPLSITDGWEPFAVTVDPDVPSRKYVWVRRQI